MVKNININTSNPLTAHPFEVVNNIYEDYILPSLVNNKNSTIQSRINIYNIIRNGILNKVDGQEIHLATKNQRSLMSYLKILEANPFHYIKDSTNSYRTNPFDMVVVRSAYPIRYNQNGLAINVGKENVNLNLRIYKLDNAAYYYPFLHLFRELDFEPWREVLYYYYVSKNIVNTFVSPHFIIPYGYFMNKNRINFDTINRHRNDDTRLERVKQYKIRKYQNKLGEVNNTSVNIGRVIQENGRNYFGGGVLLVNTSGQVLLVRNDNDSQLRLFGDELFKQGVLESIIFNASRLSGYTIQFTPSMLGRSFEDFPIRPDDDDNYYRVYFVKVQHLPSYVPNGIIYNLRDITNGSIIEETSLAALSWLIRSGENFINRLPLALINPVLVTRENPRQRVRDVDENFLAANSKTCLLILTESPTNSFMQWCSRKYDSNFTSIRVMERLGMYTDSVWENVLFQLMQALHVMDKYKVYIRNMNLLDNVFIKDIPQLNNQYWLYTIDGFEYYVANEGYLVMIDLGGIEIEEGRGIFPSRVSLGDWNEGTNIDIFDNFTRIINPNNFNSNAVSFLTNLPSEKILKLITDINREATKPNATRNISYYIEKYFTRYRHPRIGTPLTEQEKQSLSRTLKDFKRGELVAYSDNFESETIWVQYLGENEHGQSLILTFNMATFEAKKETVNKYNNLKKYMSSKPLELSFLKLTDYSHINILERYVV